MIGYPMADSVTFVHSATLAGPVGRPRGSEGAKIMRWLLVLVAVLAMVSTTGVAQAQGPSPGDPAPPFELPGSDGNTHRLSDYAGQTVVMAWFPKAFTGG